MDNCRLASELTPGETASLLHTVTEADSPLFAAATGDVNPIHFDQSYAERTFFKGRISHGMLCAGFVSAVLANRLPGLGTVYVAQTLKFLSPVRIGDTIKTEVEVLEVDAPRNRVTLRTRCVNQLGVVVLDGEAIVAPPKKRPPPEELADIQKTRVGVETTLARAVAAFTDAFQGGAGPAPEAEPSIAALDPSSDWPPKMEGWINSMNAWQERFEGAVDLWFREAIGLQKNTQEMLLMSWAGFFGKGKAGDGPGLSEQ
jgi:3-hydroxybutyryl-CoA dehydratase